MRNYKPIQVTAAILVVLAGLYCYNPFALWFQNDDFIHIPLSAKGVFLQRNTFRPVCDFSIMVDYYVWGKTAYGYHLTNLLLHIIVSVIAFYLVRRVCVVYAGIVNPFGISLFSSCLFFIYGMHSEAVFWILGRSAVLATIFSLLFFYLYIRKAESKLFVAGYLCCFLIGLLTYESTWILPAYTILLMIADLRTGKSLMKQELQHIAALIVLFLLYLIARWYFINEIAGPYEANFFLTGDFGTLIRNFAVLAARSFIPAFVIENWLLALCIVAAAVLLVLCFLVRRAQRSLVVVLVVCFALSLLPYCSLGVDTNGTEGERFLYFPTLLVCILCGVAVQAASISKPVKLVFAITLIAGNLLALLWATNNYRFAGNVVKTVATTISKQTPYSMIVAEGLPQAQHGALIFRTGFPEMVAWFGQQQQPAALVTCNPRHELAPLLQPYGFLHTQHITTNCKLPPEHYEKGAVLYLKFTDTALLAGKQ